MEVRCSSARARGPSTMCPVCVSPGSTQQLRRLRGHRPGAGSGRAHLAWRGPPVPLATACRLSRECRFACHRRSQPSPTARAEEVLRAWTLSAAVPAAPVCGAAVVSAPSCAEYPKRERRQRAVDGRPAFSAQRSAGDDGGCRTADSTGCPGSQLPGAARRPRQPQARFKASWLRPKLSVVEVSENRGPTAGAADVVSTATWRAAS